MNPKIIPMPLASEKITIIPNSIQSESPREEFIPKLIPKITQAEVPPKEELPRPSFVVQDKITELTSIPVSAILHSYPQVLSSSMEANDKIFTTKKLC